MGISDKVNKLDSVFSLYVRLRDTMPNGLCRCISCGKIYPFSQIDAGHYIPRSNIATRFDEQNVNGECIFCNRFSQNHLEGYRKNLTSKIGADNVERLETLSHQIKKYCGFEIDDMIKDYEIKVKSLKKDKW